MDNANTQTQQMLAKGGFAAGGMNKDPISGNEVPPGALPHEVRDDVPAQLSEGEFVVPASVVRFIGLDRLMKMRDKAIEGLKRMETIGQMGNSEEAKASGENPLGEFDQEEEEGEGFEEEIDDIMMATGGSVPGKSATGQDMNNWLWNQTDPNTVYRTFDPKTGQYDRSFGTAGTGWGGNTVNNRPIVTNEVRDYLTSIGYTGSFDGSSQAWNAQNNRVAAGFGGRSGAERANEIVAGATEEELAQGPNTRIPELEAFLESKGLKLQEGIQHTPGGKQSTWIQRLVGADGNPVAVDAFNDRYSADDRFMDAGKLAILAAFGSAAPGVVGAKAGTIGAGAATGATMGGMSTAMNGGDFGDVLKGAVKGGITGGAGAGLGQLAGKGWDAFMGSDVLPNSWMQGISNLEQGAGRLAGQVKEGLGIAGNAASSAPSIVPDASMFNPVVTTGSAAAGAGSALGALGGAAGTAAGIASGITGVGKPDVVLDKTEITGQRPVPDNSNVGGVAGGIVGGNVSSVTPDVNLDKVEIVGEKKPPKDESNIPPYGPIDVAPAPITPVPDKAPDAPTKDNGKTKLPKLPIREALLAAGIGAIAKSGGSSDAGGGATTLSRSNNPVVDYRPVDNQMEQLFINNRPTGRMKKKYAVGGDVNLDAYNFFAQRD